VAQRRLAASAIRARPSGDRFRFFFVFAAFVTAVGKAFSALRGRPTFRGAALPVESPFNSWRASFRAAISVSSNAITSLIAIDRIISSTPTSAFHHSQPQVVIDGDGDLLLGAKVAFGGLNRGVAEQELYLLQVAAVLAAEFRAGAAKVVGTETLDTDGFR